MVLTGIYIFCLVAGLLWALITAFLGDILGHGGDFGDHSFDVGGHDVDVSGHDVGVGDHDVAAADLDHGSGMHLGPFSPMIVAVFLATFGGIGLIVHFFYPSLSAITAFPAAVTGVLVSGVVMVGFNRLSTRVEGSSQALASHLIGLIAEVTTPIPEGRLGEISYVARGSRYIAPARSRAGGRLERNTQVLITDIQAGTFLVEPLLRDETGAGKA